MLQFNSRSKYPCWKFYSNTFFFLKNAVVTSFTRWNQFLYNVAKFTCFRHDLLHSIPQRAEIEAKEIGLQEKKVIIVWKLNLQRIIIHMMDYKNLPIWVLSPNICGFNFLAFAGAIWALACTKDNFSKWLNPTVNLSNLNAVSEELWRLVLTLF